MNEIFENIWGEFELLCDAADKLIETAKEGEHNEKV